MTSQYILYLFAKDTNLHHSCNFSTSPLPELQISMHISEVITMLISEIDKNLDIFHILKFLYLKDRDSNMSLLPLTYSFPSCSIEDKYLSYTLL